MRDARQRVLSAAYAAHPERVVRKPPQPPLLPHAVWINPPKGESASQDGAGATISIADDRRVALNVEGIGVGSETVAVSPHVITTPTEEVVRYTPRASVSKSLTRSGLTFLDFMDQLMAEMPEGKDIHVSLDNYCIHKRNDPWLAAHPNVVFHFTPTSASWHNQVEVCMETLLKGCS